MKAENLGLKGLVLMTPEIHTDVRGTFQEVFRLNELKSYGIDKDIVQINQSLSKKNVIRGLHFQFHPYSQGKLIRVIKGKIMDVAVNISQQSADFLKWESVILTDDKSQMLWIPSGFAHGFEVLSDYALVEYFCDEYYSSEHDGGIVYDDTEINIQWNTKTPVLSEKDRKLPSVRELFHGLGRFQ